MAKKIVHTEQQDRRIAEAVRWYESQAQRQQNVRTQANRKGQHWKREQILVVVTGSMRTGIGNPWRHSWAQAIWNEQTKRIIAKSLGDPISSSRPPQSQGQEPDPFAKPGIHAAQPFVRIGDGTPCWLHVTKDDRFDQFYLLNPLSPVGGALDAIVRDVVGAGWPKQYGWDEAEFNSTGTGYVIKAGGLNSDDPLIGRAKNDWEMRNGFGVVQGHGGIPLQHPSATLTPIPVPAGEKIEIAFKFNGFRLFPTFHFPLGHAVECIP